MLGSYVSSVDIESLGGPTYVHEQEVAAMLVHNVDGPVKEPDILVIFDYGGNDVLI